MEGIIKKAINRSLNKQVHTRQILLEVGVLTHLVTIWEEGNRLKAFKWNHLLSIRI